MRLKFDSLIEELLRSEQIPQQSSAQMFAGNKAMEADNPTCCLLPYWAAPIPLPATRRSARILIRDWKNSAHMLNPLEEMARIGEREYSGPQLNALYERVAGWMATQQVEQGITLRNQAAFNAVPWLIHSFTWADGRLARASTPTEMKRLGAVVSEMEGESVMIPVDPLWQEHLVATAPSESPFGKPNYSMLERGGWVLAQPGYKI